MSQTEELREQLVDLVELQPTKNAELQERWGMESGSEVHQFLESELSEYYYRNDDSLICATPEAEALVGGEHVDEDNRSIQASPLQAAIIDSLPGPEDDAQSVVATLHEVQAADVDTTVDDVRSALHGLTDRGLVERIRKTVPNFRLAFDRDRIDVEVAESE